jgi:hypothetical protein
LKVIVGISDATFEGLVIELDHTKTASNQQRTTGILLFEGWCEGQGDLDVTSYSPITRIYENPACWDDEAKA